MATNHDTPDPLILAVLKDIQKTTPRARLGVPTPDECHAARVSRFEQRAADSQARYENLKERVRAIMKAKRNP